METSPEHLTKFFLNYLISQNKIKHKKFGFNNKKDYFCNITKIHYNTIYKYE